MDVIWGYLFIFGILISLYMVIYSIYTIIKEKKHIHNLLTVDEKLSPWYMNSIILKSVRLLKDGVLLAVVSVGWWALYLKYVASASLVLSAAVFMYTCSRLVGIIAKEALRKRIARETGEERSHWLRPSQFHQEIATTIFLAGVSVSLLLTGLVSINVLSPELFSQTAWSWEILDFVGGFYWLTVHTIQIVQTRKRRA